MKYLAYLFLIFIILFFSLFIFESCTEPKSKETATIVSKKITTDQPWRKPTEEEYSTLDTLFVRNKFYDYEDFFLKEIEADTFIVACLTNEKKWDYYYSNTKSEQLTVLSSEMKRQITPP